MRFPLAALLLWTLGGCGSEKATDEPSASAAAAAQDLAPALPTASASARRAPAEAVVVPRCAHSLSANSPIDARTKDTLARCLPLRTGQGKTSLRCGLDDRKIDRESRLIEAVFDVSGPIQSRIERVAARGKQLGRDPKSFMLVGDSITVSDDFLRPFGEGAARRVELGPFAEQSLRLQSGESILAYFGGATARGQNPPPKNPFVTKRVAKVGAGADWPSHQHPLSPLGEALVRGAPAVAVVTFGANDAARSNDAPEVVADRFERDLLRLVEILEEAGIVVIVSNEMRHGDQPGRHACPGDKRGVSDWQVAVAQNANSARAMEIACREPLPWIDLRHALDGSTNYGLGPDSVHLSAYPQGAGVLTSAGFDCGYNVRNFVTLLALARVMDVLVPIYR